MSRKIVITGANAFLGERVVQDLATYTDHQITAVVSPRWHGCTSETPGDVTYIKADLTEPLSTELTAIIEKADRVFHFAWTRTGQYQDVIECNQAMIRHLMDPMPAKEKFIFMSSVTASPNTRSMYGLTKFKVASLVESNAGTVLTCGLVVEANPTKGSYRLLYKIETKCPVVLRLTSDEPYVFPIRLNDLVSSIRALCDESLEPGNYKMFAEGVRFNTFLSYLEELSPKRRWKIRLSAKFLLKSASFLKKMPLAPVRLCDQVLTFFYKEEDYLNSLKALPTATITACKNKEFLA